MRKKKRHAETNHHENATDPYHPDSRIVIHLESRVIDRFEFLDSKSQSAGPSLGKLRIILENQKGIRRPTGTRQDALKGRAGSLKIRDKTGQRKRARGPRNLDPLAHLCR